MEERIPKHVGIIMDGNRRWAKSQGKNVIEGHRAGAENSLDIIRHLYKRGVHTVTIWVFSTENWNREKIQVQALMMLFQQLADPYFKEAIAQNARITQLGRRDRIPKGLRAKIEQYERESAHFNEHALNIGLDYGGRDEIIRGIRRMQNEGISADDLTEENFNDFLDTKDTKYPQPDIVIRTGGEHRMSGFLVWQAAYAEYFFPEKFLPAVTTDDLDAILDEYKNRERRFGK